MLKHPFQTGVGKWLLAVFLLGALNFTVFWFATLAIGGDGINGKVEDGHYYARDKVGYTEVSPAVWHYTRVHAMSIWITHPLMFLAVLCAAALERTKKPAGDSLCLREQQTRIH